MERRPEDDEIEEPLKTAALKNAEAMLIARQRVERELLAAKEALERKSEELWQQREQFRVTLASVGDAVITTDTQARIVFLNPVAEAMTGWTSSEAQGRPLDEVFRIVSDETRLAVPHPVSEVLRTGTVVAAADPTSLVRKDGVIVGIENSAAPIRDTAGNISGCVMVFRDLIQRRTAEALHGHLVAVIESSNDAIISKTLDGIITTWNHGAERIFGYQASEVIGKPVTVLIPPNHSDEEPAILDRMRRGETVEPYETVRLRKDGKAS
jgi:PAS domain S-box-containing protein